MIHPARDIHYRDLYRGLFERVLDGRVVFKRSGDLKLFCYSQKCVFERGWDWYTKLARGLILDTKKKRVVATPFPKFFNYGEMSYVLPNRPYRIYDKLDGSMVTIFHHKGWQAATKGSFDSPQARWASLWLQDHPGLTQQLVKGWTYVAEAIYPENKIVVDYGDMKGLILTAVYRDDGVELEPENYPDLWPRVFENHYMHIDDLVEFCKHLPSNREGFVVRFDNGHRIKIKGEEYLRVHRLISECTPLAIWRVMKEEGPEYQSKLTEIRRELPEEFWDDFDNICCSLLKAIDDIINAAYDYYYGNFYDKKKGLRPTDKELGLALKDVPQELRGYMFPIHRDEMIVDKCWDRLCRDVRPTGNEING